MKRDKEEFRAGQGRGGGRRIEGGGKSRCYRPLVLTHVSAVVAREGGLRAARAHKLLLVDVKVGPAAPALCIQPHDPGRHSRVVLGVVQGHFLAAEAKEGGHVVPEWPLKRGQRDVPDPWHIKR